MPSHNSHRRVPPPAYMQEEDEEGNVAGSVTYATSSAASPTKERPNTGKSRRGSRRETASPTMAQTDSDSTAHQSGSSTRRDSKKSSSKSEPKERSVTTTKKVTLEARPPTRHSRTSPGNIDTTVSRRRGSEAAYYGVQDSLTPATTVRPRINTAAAAARPTSYYGASSRPPLSASAFYHYPQTPTSFPPPQWVSQTPAAYAPQTSTMVQSQYAPLPSSLTQSQYAPQPSAMVQSKYAPQPSPIVAPSPTTDYFNSQPAPPPMHHLQHRFSLNRPQSAMGFRQAPPAYQQLQRQQEQEQQQAEYTGGDLVRRRSLRRPAREEEQDRMAMPPPPRPMSARPVVSIAQPPPYPRRVAFGEEDFGGDEGLFQDVSPGYSQPIHIPPTRVRRMSIGSTVAYDPPEPIYQIDDRSGRRNSYYGGGSSAAASWDDKINAHLNAAASYQTVVEGSGPNLPLTAETLRKATKTSSRSTRSTASRDESDYRQSATTRTTRSSSGGEDITIKVTGQATLKVAGTEIQCDGGEINIARSQPAHSVRGGSSDQSSVYVDERDRRDSDRRSRVDRSQGRARANSQSGSYTRTQYAPTEVNSRRGSYYYQ